MRHHVYKSYDSKEYKQAASLLVAKNPADTSLVENQGSLVVGV